MKILKSLFKPKEQNKKRIRRMIEKLPNLSNAELLQWHLQESTSCELGYSKNGDLLSAIEHELESRGLKHMRDF